jgi:hypothetical protein
MSTYNYSYNVLINRLEAFAAGHFLIKRFTHGQIDLADQLQDEEYPFMHVVPEKITPVDGGMQFDFLIMFADIPRDKEYKAEYQREVISDCVRLGQDLIAEVKNGLQLFGFDVQLTNNPTFEPFMEEQKNTVTGVTFILSLEVPWDWSACDIPAIWAVGGDSTGGTGTGYGITLQTDGVNNVVQNLLNLESGANITIIDNGNGTITINSTGGTQVNSDWNATSGVAEILNKPTLATVATSGDYNDLSNLPTIPAAQVNSDWNAVSGVAEILNKPTLATVATTGDYNDLINTPAPQGLQDVITTDNELNVNNIIVGNGTDLEWQSNTRFRILPENTGYFEFQVGKLPNTNRTTFFGDTNGGYIECVGSTGQKIAIQPNRILFITPAVYANTATNGQVLTLVDAISGRVEYTTISAGSGTVTSVALTTPAAFNVTGSPITTSGTLAITGAGTSAEYVDGTGALQTFPALTGFVPYTGATQDVDLDTFKLSASSVYIEGTAGNGHLHLKHQSADATATGQSTSLWADTNGDIKWKNDGNYKTTLKTSSNTADRVYTFPNETAELMPRNAAITGATKTKITYDSDGLVTAGADLAATDIPSGIDATKIGSGAVDNTEFGYLNGVTSDIQTQLNNKKDTFTIRMQVAGQSPADATTYYVGEISVSLNTNATLYRTTMPYASKLIGAVISAVNTSAGSTTEASTINFRLNNTTDTLLSNAVAFGNNLTVNVYTITGLNVAVAANDTFNIKWTTPTWATNPTGATLLVTLYFERT